MEKKRTIKETATATIKGFKAVYEYEFEEGGRPEVTYMRATKEGTEMTIDASFYSSTRNLQFTLHYVEPDFDMSILSEIFKNIKYIGM